MPLYKTLFRVQQVAPWIVFVVFCLITVAVNVWHEPWVDEAEPWLAAQHAGIWHLLTVVPGYIGTPVLWHLLLYPFAQLGVPFVIVKVLNGLIVCLATVLILWKSPFPLWVRLLLPFNYYFLYEFNAIARTYGLTTLLLLCVAWAFPQRTQRPLWFVALLLFLAQTSSHGTVIAGVFFFGLFIEYIFIIWSAYQQSQTHAHTVRKLKLPHLSTALLFGAVGFVTTFWILRSPPDLAEHLRGIHTTPFSVLVDLWNFHPVLTFFPTIFARVDFWNSSQLIPWLQTTPIGYLLVACAIWYFWNSSTYIRWLVYGGYFFLEVFFSIVYLPAQRHLGIVFVFILVCFWIDFQERKPSQFQLFFVSIFIILSSVTQIFTSSIAIAQDRQYLFSSAQQTAEHIPGTQSDTTIIAYPSYLTIGILPYIDDRYTEVYALEQERFVQYIQWTKNVDMNLSSEEVELKISRALEQIHTPHVIFIVPTSNQMDLKNSPQIVWKEDRATVVTYQQFMIYQLR